MLYTNEVFGVVPTINQYSYCDRSGLDGKLSRLLRRNSHIAIKGPSKCGKSWLRQKCLQDAIIVQCRIGMTKEDIYKQALFSLNIPFNVQRSSETNILAGMSGNAEGKIPFFAKAEIEASGSVSHSKGFNIPLDFSTSLHNLEFIANSIKESKKKLVIEDFHYLDLDARKELAFDLKTLWDYGCYIIIIGVWAQTNLLTYMNPDLTGRIEEISVSWEDDELRQVIRKGSNALNIEIDSHIENEMIHDSFGNVGILQSLLLQLVEEEAGIVQNQTAIVNINNFEFYINAAKAYANQLDGLYYQFAQTLSKGIRRRKKSTGIYALSMEAIVKAPDWRLMNGFSRDDMFSIIHQKEPRVQKGNLKTVLKKLVELQDPRAGSSLVISYDESIDSIFIVDLQLLFYRKHHTMKWPWEDLVEEAREFSLFDLEDDSL